MKFQKSKTAELEADANDMVNNERPKIVLPDECGDSLWDEVLKQSPNLTTVFNKPTGILPEDAATLKENAAKSD